MRQDPIQQFDSSGKQYQLCIRTFAPWKEFSGFEGDNRGFSTSADSTYRTGGFLVFDLSTLSIFTEPVGKSSGTRSDPNEEREFSDVTTRVSNIRSADGKLSLTFATAGANPMIPLSPDIDVVLELTTYIKHGGLFLKGSAKGDGFPNVEAFVRDSKENAYMLGEFSTDYGPTFGPIMALPGAAKTDIFSFEIGIMLDVNGLFNGSTTFMN